MKILFVSATLLEAKPLLKFFSWKKKSDNFYFLQYDKLEISLLITGVGIVFTTFNLSETLNTKDFDLVINIGICGSFNNSLKPGDLLDIKEDQFADLGIETNDGFSTIFETGFTNKHEYPFRNAKLQKNTNSLFGLTEATGITVNKAHCKMESIQLMKQKFVPDTESMEGAAFFYVCLKKNVNCCQIRSVSNFVKPREIAEWNIPLAVRNLNLFLKEIITTGKF